jgi:hypothetical protein
MSWLCKLGLHDWLGWTVVCNGKQYRMCYRCGLYESRVVEKEE